MPRIALFSVLLFFCLASRPNFSAASRLGARFPSASGLSREFVPASAAPSRFSRETSADRECPNAMRHKAAIACGSDRRVESGVRPGTSRRRIDAVALSLDAREFSLRDSRGNDVGLAVALSLDAREFSLRGPGRKQPRKAVALSLAAREFSFAPRPSNASEGECEHEWETFVVPPTCAHKGYALSRCAKCGREEKSDFTPATGHEFVTEIVPPTCVERGYARHRCVKCGHEFVDGYCDPVGHEYVVEETPPTCEEDGRVKRECVRCGHVETERGRPKTGHDFVLRVVPPTCDSYGYSERVCSVCGATIASDYVPPSGHEFETVRVAPDKDRVGYTLYRCKKCDFSYVSDYVRSRDPDFVPPERHAHRYVLSCEINEPEKYVACSYRCECGAENAQALELRLTSNGRETAVRLGPDNRLDLSSRAGKCDMSVYDGDKRLFDYSLDLPENKSPPAPVAESRDARSEPEPAPEKKRATRARRKNINRSLSASLGILLLALILIGVGTVAFRSKRRKK